MSYLIFHQSKLFHNKFTRNFWLIIGLLRRCEIKITAALSLTEEKLMGSVGSFNFDRDFDSKFLNRTIPLFRGESRWMGTGLPA